MVRTSAHSKRIVVLPYGSRGDAQPFVALGAGHQRVGHAVPLAAPATFSPLVRAHGPAFTPVVGDPFSLWHALSQRAGSNYLRMVMEIVRYEEPW